jgi:4-hydroxybenzoate polyprenyltransferase
LWVAAGGFPGWHLLLVFTLGTVLMRSAGCCVNDVADRDFDRHVKRTAQRPVTSGKVSVKEALAVGAVPALIITLAYPFAKRVLSMPQAVLGVAFSFGIPMAFAAVQGAVPVLAWVLLLGNLFWVLAYDTEYAMVDRDDDLRIGMKTSAITLGRLDVAAVTAFYLLHLAIWTVALWPQLRPVVWLATLAVALGQVVWHFMLIRHRTREGCFAAFRANHWLGFTVFVGVVVGLV